MRARRGEWGEGDPNCYPQAGWVREHRGQLPRGTSPFWGGGRVVLGVTEGRQNLKNDVAHFAMALLLKDLMKNVLH